MTDHPILFTGTMVNAILREIRNPGTGKRQTRRILDLGTDDPVAFVGNLPGGPTCIMSENEHGELTRWPRTRAVGDRLWVREAWADQHPLAIQRDRYSQPGRAGIPGPPKVPYRTIYRADGEPLQIWRSGLGHPYFSLDAPDDPIDRKYPTVRSNFTRAKGQGIHWSPSTNMPRWASRITLDVTEVRVQRLQDISEADAKAEGAQEVEVAAPWPRHLEWGMGWHHGQQLPNGHPFSSPKISFANLWNQINGPDAWDKNPWVAAYTFTPHLKNKEGE